MSVLVLKCRNCGGDVVSNERARKCRHCSELFPFECAVCSRHLRPPLPDYPVERFFNDDGLPLCEDHYQRQCPECDKWFRADENPGFFLCTECTTRRDALEKQEAAPTAGPARRSASPSPAQASASGSSSEPSGAAEKKGGCGGSAALVMALGSGLAWWLARAFSA